MVSVLLTVFPPELPVLIAVLFPKLLELMSIADFPPELPELVLIGSAFSPSAPGALFAAFDCCWPNTFRKDVVAGKG
jgi:hypothetical protein